MVTGDDAEGIEVSALQTDMSKGNLEHSGVTLTQEQYHQLVALLQSTNLEKSSHTTNQVLSHPKYHLLLISLLHKVIIFYYLVPRILIYG